MRAYLREEHFAPRRPGRWRGALLRGARRLGGFPEGLLDARGDDGADAVEGYLDAGVASVALPEPATLVVASQGGVLVGRAQVDGAGGGVLRHSDRARRRGVVAMRELDHVRAGYARARRGVRRRPRTAAPELTRPHHALRKRPEPRRGKPFEAGFEIRRPSTKTRWRVWCRRSLVPTSSEGPRRRRRVNGCQALAPSPRPKCFGEKKFQSMGLSNGNSVTPNLTEPHTISCLSRIGTPRVNFLSGR